MEYNIITSINSFNIIGINNKLIVTCKEDLQYFKKLTTTVYPETKDSQNILIMGYNTWLSMNSTPLPNRISIVITKNHSDMIQESENVKVFKGLDDMFTWTQENVCGRLFVIGGGKLFSHCMETYPDYLNRLYITEFYSNFISRRPESIIFEKYPNYYTDFPIVKKTSSESMGKEYNYRLDKYEDNELKYHFIMRQNPKYMNQEENQYITYLQNILKDGCSVTSRNSDVMNQFGIKMEFNLQTHFPLITTKKMPFKTILRELLWFIRGSTNNKELQDKNVHIWDQNGSKEFLKSRGLDYNEGDLGPIYGFQWRHNGATYDDCYQDYTGKGVDQLQYVIDEIRNNPSSRRIIMSAWNPSDIPKMALPPCHILIQFYVNQDKNELDAQMYQRSGDMFLGVPFNIASYSILIYIIANMTGYKPGRFIHIIGDAHIYQAHMEAVKEQIERDALLFPCLRITETIQDINKIDESIFILEKYTSQPKISAPMIA